MLTGVVITGGAITLIAGFGANLRLRFANELQFQDAVRERVLAQTVETEEDPKLIARLELARIALRSRASLMRGDANRLWQRSIWAYRGAFIFFLLAIAGPGVAAAIVLNSSNPDWHFMFGGLSLAAVPLGIGTALLRHDAKLREQYQQAAQDIASLERYELALDYAHISSQETYQLTMQQVINQLILGRNEASITRGTDSSTSDGDLGASVQKIMSTAAEKTSNIIETLAQKK
ncbi:hypothetical protein [Corallococcus sp. AS-1-6]|uniref:hypothetical protein n=1 Tax=Corallococcus sp. AS-1-6 TaxID=2874599 RepID=UPI001CBF9AB8|nr:hypothetical protein [Corallococcus sp. AS-1-6]MBZ4370131.1 hypothetical protein [Corallococcus sp. AS-1-6]